jgi:two-component system chemotaxis response regulator CheB
MQETNGTSRAGPVNACSVVGRVIAIGASTGGTEAIAAVLSAMPEASPPIVVAQHIPEMFSRSFSERVDRMSPLTVREATHGEPVLPGHAYVAPGNYHLTLARSASGYTCVLDQTDRVNRHRPSVDVLFESVARTVRGKAVGVMLTGMGSDGARGLKAMREAGAHTLAQDKATSVVWGMPGSAVEMGAVEKIVALDRIAAEIVSYVNG